MDSVAETPVKRRRTENGYVATQSQEQEFQTQDTVLLDQDDIQPLRHSFETVPTLPIAAKAPTTPPRLLLDEDDDFATLPFSVKETPIQRPSSPLQSSYMTQPTQIVNPSNPVRLSSPVNGTEKSQQPQSAGTPSSTVQVVASSPTKSSPQPASAQFRRPNGILANVMAPAGTAFRPPVVARRTNPSPPKTLPQNVVDLSSDDEVHFAGGSSGDEKYNRDLKPTLVKSSSSGSLGVKSTQSSFGGGLDRFRHGAGPAGATSGSFSRESIMDRSADPMASAYGNISRPARPRPSVKKQVGPAKALPIEDISITDIADYNLRQKVLEIGMILPHTSILDRRDALLAKREHVNDAMDLLTTMKGTPTAKQESDDELSSQAPRTQTTKLQIKDKRTVIERQQERIAAAAILDRKTAQVNQTRPPPPPELTVEHIEQRDPAPGPGKPRRRLMQRSKVPRNASPPSSPGTIAAAVQTRPQQVIAVSDDESDSGVAEEPAMDLLREGSLLKHLNECTVEDLVDMSSAKPADVEMFLSNRPFRTMEEARNVVKESALKPGAKRKGKSQPIGQKIVDICEEMWTGYDAVDQLVQNCEAIGRPLVEEMEKWGVSVFGNSTDGELELVKFDDESDVSAKDSGIGTPSSMSADEEGGVKGMARRRNRGQFFEQPVTLAKGVVLKDYQVVGINWLALLYRKSLSCILADDMGLGKTCQVIAFIAHLIETGTRGPHIIVVPSSVLENWLREFEHFCPSILVMPYHANLNERGALQQSILDHEPQVIVTTYTIAKKTDDRRFLSKLEPTSCIYDEGHMLKNPNSEQYKELMKIRCKFRLLLTGTPLQNNLSELIALLGFLMPQLFAEHHEDLQAIFKQKATTNEEQHQALLSAQRIARARSMMTPFILRRKKHQVLKDIPAKHRRVDYCPMTESQGQKYSSIVDNYRDMIQRRQAGGKITAKETSNILMSLRKAAIHPLLFRRLYTDDLLRKISKTCKKEPEFSQSNVNFIYEDLEYASDMELHRWCLKYPSVQKFALKNDEWMDSGKVEALVELLKQYRDNGDRVLIFSQFVMVLDILEEVLETIKVKFGRLDGDVDINDRQALIDGFYRDESIMAFMLSTKAGGAGVNLACANKVIIFDGSFNPQDDVQAENRAHRVGQTREVEVVRLVTKGTVEEQIHALGQTKLALDERVAGEAGEDDKKAEKAGEKRVGKMLEDSLEAKE